MRTKKSQRHGSFDALEYQVIGLPEWAISYTGLFEIIAKVEVDRMPTEPEVRQMLQSLLADRFQLRFHRETRNIPAYAASDRPIIDKSGLDGQYKFVQWDVQGIRAGNVSLVTLVDQKLGLKLELQGGPAKVLVIDRVERTSSKEETHDILSRGEGA